MHLRQLFASLFGGLALFGTLANGIAFGADWKTLPGHVPRAIAKLQAIGRVAPTNQLRLAIGVPLRDPAGLDEFLAQLYDPASPNYRQYLTPEEFTARFGPTEQDYEAVKQFARANGLTILETHGNRLRAGRGRAGGGGGKGVAYHAAHLPASHRGAAVFRAGHRADCGGGFAGGRCPGIKRFFQAASEGEKSEETGHSQQGRVQKRVGPGRVGEFISAMIFGRLMCPEPR